MLFQRRSSAFNAVLVLLVAVGAKAEAEAAMAATTRAEKDFMVVLLFLSVISKATQSSENPLSTR
jgi:hypothetical protein